MAHQSKTAVNSKPNTNHSINITNSSINIKNTNSNVDPELIWIDYNIDNGENRIYQKMLNEILPFKGFKANTDGINEFKKIKFKKLMLMLTNSIFYVFIPLFEREKREIFCCLNVIVFTQKEKIAEVENFCKENKKISSGYLFDKTKIFDDIEKIKEFIKQTKKKHIKFKDNFETIMIIKFFLIIKLIILKKLIISKN